MTVRATLGFVLTPTEVFSAAEVPSAGGDAVRHNGFNYTVQLTGTTTPAVSQVYAEELTGPQSLDLTALTRTQRTVLDATGLKLQALLLNNLSTTDPVVIADGAANPYSINGTADVTIPVSGRLQLYFPEGLADVAAGAKAIDITAAAGERFQLIMIFG